MKIVTNKKDSSQRNKLGGFEVFQKNETEGYGWKMHVVISGSN